MDSKGLIKFFLENIVLAAILSLIATLAMHYVITRFFILDVFIETSIQAFLIVLIGLGIFIFRVLRVRGLVYHVLQIVSLARPHARKEITAFLENILKDTEKTVSDLRKPKGALMERDKAELVYKLCFQFRGDQDRYLEQIILVYS